MAWPFSRVLDYLYMSVTPDRDSYPASVPVRLTITIVNRDSNAFEPPDDYHNRSAHFRFMERQGWGLFVVALGVLFKTRPLRIGSAESLKTSIQLEPQHLASRTEVIHYEMPPSVRTFQVFLPLGIEEAEGYRNMLVANSEGVTVEDSWIHTR